MPIYEYVCPNCHVKFEALRPATNGHQLDCLTCGTESPRVFSIFAAVSKSADGEAVPIGGGGCACSGGGACGCAASF